jgi:hypothetical protein
MRDFSAADAVKREEEDISWHFTKPPETNSLRMQSGQNSSKADIKREGYSTSYDGTCKAIY